MMTMISNEEIEEVFANTNFGNRNHRKLLEQGVLKIQAGYRSGHTLTTIMQKLGLISIKHTILKKGRKFLFEAFYDNTNSG